MLRQYLELTISQYFGRIIQFQQLNELCRRTSVVVLFFIALLNLSAAGFVPLNKRSKQKLLLVSLDGFRWDFRNKTSTPYIDKIFKEGVSVDYVKNVFPTKTFPNHQSIVTGLYPENHGIIDNTFLNPENGRIFHGESDSEWWNQSTPIWIENEKQGGKSAVCFWPGYRVKYENRKVDYLPDNSFKAPYESDNNKTVMPLADRLKLIIDWLKIDEINFVALYVEEVDDTAHNYAPDSNYTKNKNQLKTSLKTIDDLVGSLKDQLEKHNLSEKVNVLFIGDHGHINTTYKQVVDLDDFIDTKKDLRFIDGFTNIFLYTKAHRTNSVYKTLLRESQKNESHFKVYLKKDIPQSFHVKNNKHTSPILLLPDPGWIVKCKAITVPYLRGKWQRGDHGYSNHVREMQPTFFGFGPMLKKGYHQEFIETVDLFSLMCYILHIKMDKRDGKLERVKGFFADADPHIH